MIRIALIGLGKMGLSHQAILMAHPEVELVAVCDPARYLTDLVGRYTGVRTHHDLESLLREETLDAVVIAAPSRHHAAMVRAALERNLHVFCEKPFTLRPADSRALAELARERRLVNQVGYHLRFLAAFAEARALVAEGVIGPFHHVRVEVAGPVVLRPSGGTWRSRAPEGGGCLYDYACHGVDLLHFVVGRPERVTGSVVRSVFSRDVDDEVYATLHFPGGATGQFAANWSDESHRKMSTRISVWGPGGRIDADRQECRLYLRKAGAAPTGRPAGWSVRYTTDLTAPVWYYLRGEEYSAQIDRFVQAIRTGIEPESTFESAAETDAVVEAIRADAAGVARPAPEPRRAVAGSGGWRAALRRVMSHG